MSEGRDRRNPLNWKRILGAGVGLAASFFLALDATALEQHGRFRLGALLAGTALLVAAIAAITVLPGLVKRTVFGRWMSRTRFELTREGAAYLLIILLITLASLNTGNNLLFMILTILFAGILASGLCSKMVLAGIELELSVPEHVFAGQPTSARLKLRNTKRRLPSFSITVSSGTSKPGRGASSMRPLQSPGGVLNEPIYAPYVPSRGTVTQHVTLKFARRGRYGQDAFMIRSKFPFGILRCVRFLPWRCEVLVFPAILPTAKIARLLHHSTAELEQARKGRGEDIYAIRDYREGDSARHVHWKGTAKTQRLKVREFSEQEENCLTLIFDTGTAGTDAATLEKFEKLVSLGASVAWSLSETGVRLQFLSADFSSPMAPAADVIYLLLEWLATVEPDSSPHAGGFLASVSAATDGFPVIFTMKEDGPDIPEGAMVVTPN